MDTRAALRRPARLPLLLVTLLALWLPGAAAADTLNVTTTTDSGSGSLRGRVAAANVGDTVFLPASAAHYMVTAGEIPIVNAITIKGAGAGSAVVDAAGNSRVFHVTSSADNNATVTFQGVTVTGGKDVSGPGGGGILVDSGSIALIDAAVTHNKAEETGAVAGFGGGGIYNRGVDTTLTRSSVSDNILSVSSSAGQNGGGGIYNNGSGALTVVDGSHVDRNQVSVTGPDDDLSTCCGGGGGLYQNANAALTVSGSTVSANTVLVHSGDCCHGGGGIFLNPAGVVTASIAGSAINDNQVTVEGNPAETGTHCCSGGGAVMTLNELTVSGSVLNRNTATVTVGDCCHGGGAINIDSTHAGGTKLTDSALSDNTTTVTGSGCCSGGGGLMFDTTAGGLTTNRVLISGNKAGLSGSTLSGGGGVLQSSNTAVDGYVNTTISGNSTDAPNPQGGGGIYVIDGIAALTTLANVSMAGNSAPNGSGGGVLKHYASGLRSKNSLIAQNTAATGGDCAAATAGPVFTSLGFNLDGSPDTCGFTAAGDRAVPPASVGLAALADNGGPTRTRALLAGSPAIDGANPAGCTDLAGNPLSTDQRGQPRPTDGSGDLIAVCDNGAFEVAKRLPKCTLAAATKAVRKKKKSKKLTLKLTAGCDENATVSVSGKIVVKPKKRKHHKKPKKKTVTLAAVAGSAKANTPLTLTVKLPKSAAKALLAGAKESASFALAATNANGPGTATAQIAKLKGPPKKKHKKH